MDPWAPPENFDNGQIESFWHAVRVCALAGGARTGVAHQVTLAPYLGTQGKKMLPLPGADPQKGPFGYNAEHFLQALVAMVDDIDFKKRKNTGVILNLSWVQPKATVGKMFGDRYREL